MTVRTRVDRRHFVWLKTSAPRCLCLEGYEPKHPRLAMVGRAQSMPPEANPFWSERLQSEVALQRSRPGDLPIPQDDGEGEWEMEEETAPVQDKRTGCVGKGRGGASGSTGSNRMFVTPPSTCWRDGRGNGLGRRSDGVMPPDSVGSEGHQGQQGQSWKEHDGSNATKSWSPCAW